ncbi:hypothetical protein CTAYLR_002825 [Chrysophaeum taylorii]|uniref:Impact N-terminal domain-containing protein n=1 Tax=Chrysophaeum taylorii TaxID=2483200 RepID=A0AAD7U8R8_9STRA|nr:hypothetical protein CTAYLR_002825 [Chrysophaeum taylorii]
MMITTASVRFKRCRFTGHAVPVRSPEEALHAVESLRRPDCCVPYAYRLCGGEQGGGDEGDVGASDKLLHLLQHWDVENVAVVVCRDDSRTFIEPNFLGPRRFKPLLDCAKAVLELCYVPDDVDEETETPPTPSKPSPPELAAAQRAELRSVRRPHVETELVLRCVAVLLDGPRWLWSRRGDSLDVASDLDWLDLRLNITDGALNDRLLGVDPRQLSPVLLDKVATLLANANLGPKAIDALRAKSTVAAEFFPWLWACLRYHRRREDGKKIGEEASTEVVAGEDPPAVGGRQLAAPLDPQRVTRLGQRVEAVASSSPDDW